MVKVICCHAIDLRKCEFNLLTRKHYLMVVIRYFAWVSCEDTEAIDTLIMRLHI